jgi:hypothetical protein
MRPRACMVRGLYDVRAGRAAVRADNRFEDVGAASLAPGLMGMAQLTSLNLNGAARIGGASAAPHACNPLYTGVVCTVLLRRRLCEAGVAGSGLERGTNGGGGARAEIAIGDAGAASLAPSLAGMAQLTSLDLGSALRGTACACAVPHARSPDDAHGCGWRGADRGACAQRCSGLPRRATMGGGLEQRAYGAAVRAENRIEAAGTASLAPVLVRLSQLKSLGLDSTLGASLALEPVHGMLLLVPVEAVARGAVALSDRLAVLYCFVLGKHIQ